MPSERERKWNKEGEIAGLEGMSSTNTRILEIRKEKSRDAARSRRGKENYEFYELAKMLPLPAAITSQLDKASIIRLSISYLKLRDFSSHGDPPWNRDGPPPNKSIKGGPPRRRNLTAVAMEIFESHQGTHILQSLDGFGFALANDGRFLYISETVSIYLGLSQVEMTGSSVFDYVHVQDHPELAEHLGLGIPQGGVPSPGSLSDDGSTGGTPRSVSPPLPDKASLMNPSPTKGPDRSFCIRMKSTLTKRGVHVKTSGYRVVYIIGHHRSQFSFSLNRKHTPPLLGLVGVAIALPPPTITELRMESDTFVIRLSPEFKVLYCEPKIAELMDLQPDDLTNNILYDHCHAADLQKLRKSHIDLLGKGQVMTDSYRLMNKHGGYVWVQTCATTLCTAKNLEEQNVVAVNYVLSGVEYGGCVMDSAQLQSLPNRDPDQSDHTDHSDVGSDQESDRRKNDKETQKSGDDKKTRDSEVTRFGAVSKNQQHSPGHKSQMSEGHKEGSLVCSSPVERVQKVPNDRYSPQPARVSSLENDSVFHERQDCFKSDGKNSRRKMDRPRKRKREAENEYEINGVDHFDEEGMIIHSRANIVPTGGLPNMCSRTAPRDGSSLVSSLSASREHDLVHVGHVVLSPVPEDLSVKTSSPSPLVVPSMATSRPIAVDISRQNSVSSHSETDWSKSGGEDKGEGITTSSVKDLEEAMNKHLPALPESSPEPRISVSDTVADNRSDSSCLHAKQKSTIQWIGSQQPPPDPLAASNLLRSLYANRESVIRTNICNTRPHYYGDQVAVNMLTPPGNDGYKDPLSSLHHQLQHQPGKQPTSTLHSSISSYSSTPITVAMTTHMTDSSYNMTPPSSVSPQDKFVSPFSDGTFTDGASSHCPSTEDPCQRLPIKPQLYSVPMPAHLPSYTDRSSSLSYPSISTYNSTGAGFPAYTSSPNVGTEPNSSWYSTHFATQ